MPAYAVNNVLSLTQQNLSSSYKTQVVITAATGATTLRRGWVYEFEIGADNVPNATDCPIMYNAEVQTAVGTATSVTPNPIDVGGADAAALLVYAVNATAEGTITPATTSLFYLGLNQRASQRWIARDEKSALIIPAVNLKGIAFRAKSTNYTSTVGWHCFVTE